MSVSDRDLRSLGPWPKGKNNVAPETELPDGSLREALNVDITDKGKLRRRKGRTKIYDGTGIHSLWGNKNIAVFVENGSLMRLYQDNTVAELVSGLDANRYVSYEEVNGEIYYSNGAQKGILSAAGIHRPWGITPASISSLSTVTGNLLPGVYIVAATYTTATGEESGASYSEQVVIRNTSGVVNENRQSEGIRLTVASHPDAVSANIYLSKPGEPELRLFRGGVALDTPVDILGLPVGGAAGRRLETQSCDDMPAGHIVRYYRGRIYSAVENVVYYSLPVRYGLTRPHENFFMFPERVTNIVPVDDGIFILADKTYFMGGDSPEKMQQVTVSPYGGVEGTDLRLSPSVFDIEEVAGDVGYWFGDKGSTLGLPGGIIQNVTEDSLAVPEYEKGATLFRAENGVRQLVTSCQGGGQGSALEATDTASAEVIRNGVLLQ